MTTFIPRQLYSQEEIDTLYPKELELQLVQIVRPAPRSTLCDVSDRLT